MPRKSVNIRSTYLLLAGIIILLAAIFFLIPPPHKTASTEPDRTDFTETDDTTPSVIPSAETTETIPEPVDSIDSDAPILYIVLDDAGNSLGQLEPFLKFPGKLTFAVMPQRTYTRESLNRIRAAGYDAILHQPMEAMNGDENPGAGALYTGMSAEEIETVLDRNLDDLPGIQGMNNHMGSRATSDSNTMRAFFAYLRENRLFFLDSYTSAGSVALQTAEDMNVPYIRRSVFIDNEKDKESMLAAINKGLDIAKQNGHAVMIGHVTSSDLAELLIELYPGFIEDGFTLKDLSSFLLEDAGV